MAGLRVQNIPGSVTDKQLKVYFSNPKHGGGPIKKLLYPMPSNSAVIIYEDAADAQQVMTKRHKVGEDKLTLKTLPRQIYRLTSVQVDKQVSEFMSHNSDIVDELQFVGELAVDFSYEREAYVMSGSWYQLEWAMQHLENMLNVYEFDKELEYEAGNQLEAAAASKTEEIKQPNIPSVPAEEQEPARPANALDGYVETAFASKPPRKNKNMVPLKPGETAKAKAPANMPPNMESRGVHGNKNTKRDTGRRENGGGWFKDDSGDEMLGAMSFLSKHQDILGLDAGRHAGRPGRNVQFDPNTDFTEKQRPFAMPPQPRKTRGLDVAQAGFEEFPMTHMFTTAGGLTVRIAKDDITKQATECIVNGTSKDLGNTYGVSRAILGAVGQKLQLECLNYIHTNGNLNVTQVMHTSAGGRLDPKVKFILHTVGPSWSESRSEEVTHSLVLTYINCLQYADKTLQLRSIAMPLISAGAFGFPLDVCVQAFYDAILLLSSSGEPRRSLKEVHLICFDEDSTMAVIMILQSLQDCNTDQATQIAIDRYKSNISQNGAGAENILLSFKIPEVNSRVEMPEANSRFEIPEANARVKMPEQPQETPADERPHQAKLDDKDDSDSEMEEASAKAKEPDVTYRNLSESESEDELKAESEFKAEGEFKAVRGDNLRGNPYVMAEEVDLVQETSFVEDETRDAENETRDSDLEDNESQDEEEPKVWKGSKNEKPGSTDRRQFAWRDAEEVACSDIGQSEDRFYEDTGASSGYKAEHERKVLESPDDSDSDNEKDYEVKREQTDDTLPELDADNTDEIVSNMSSILQRIQTNPDEADDTSDRDGDTSDRDGDTSDRDGDSDVRAGGRGVRAKGVDVHKVRDPNLSDSVGGSMVIIDKADFSDEG